MLTGLRDSQPAFERAGVALDGLRLAISTKAGGNEAYVASDFQGTL